MMDCWNSRTANRYILFCIILFIQSTFAQEGFISISDENWYPEREGCCRDRIEPRKARFFRSDLVLKTAVIHPERLEFVHEDLDTGHYNYVLHLHLFELNDSVQAGQRVFDIYINNEMRQRVDILASNSRYQVVVLNFTANRFLNLTLAKASNVSELGPICTAYEILQALPWTKETAPEETLLPTSRYFHRKLHYSRKLLMSSIKESNLTTAKTTSNGNRSSKPTSVIVIAGAVGGSVLSIAAIIIVVVYF